MTAMNPPAQDRAPIELPHRVRMEILFAVLLGILLAALDQTIVGTALPVIVTDLNGNDVYVWAFTAYLLTATVSGPIYGKLSDLYGRRPIFLIGVSIFLVGSALCGLSQEMWQFILFRGIQGLGAGALSRWRSRSSATSSRRPSGASTRASSERCSASARLSDRPSAGSSPTPSAGTGSSSSTCRLARSSSS